MIATILAAALATASQFDLVCTGPLTVKDNLRNQSETGDITYRFRVDLDTRRYCVQLCEKIGELTVTDDTLQVAGYAFSINRITGKVQEENSLGPVLGMRVANNITDTWDATCTPAPFSGFPRRF